MIGMNIQNFESFIDSKILTRGRNYYKSGAVESLGYAEAGNFWTAGVCGSDYYSVSAELSSSNNILDANCDCPYDMGEFCKHQVAVFYAIREKIANQPTSQKRNLSSMTFMEQIEIQIETKSLKELRSLVLRMAKRIPESFHSDFLEVLENKRIVIDREPSEDIGDVAILSKIQAFCDNADKYNIEAYYQEDGYRWDGYYDDENDGEDGWNIEDDEGFAKDFTACYNDAEKLLINANYLAAAKAFQLIFEAIEKFDEKNSDHDYGEISINTLIDTGKIDVDMRRIKALRGYSYLMSFDNDSCREALINELSVIFALCYHYVNPIMFQEVLTAGNVPIPNMDTILTAWQEVLFSNAPERTAKYVKELAVLSKNQDIMLDFVSTVGAQTPIAYLQLCELLSEENMPKSEIIAYAKSGLVQTQPEADKRIVLAELLIKLAEEADDKEAYNYAVMERFYTNKNLKTYVPVLSIGSESANSMALNCLAQLKEKNRNYYVIQMLNQNYQTAFDAIKNDKQSLGWSGWSPSIKGQLFPFFLGLCVRHDSKAVIIKKLAEEAAGNVDNVYEMLKKNRPVVILMEYIFV